MVDWEGLKAKYAPAEKTWNSCDYQTAVEQEFLISIMSHFPAILAAHERDQRVILAAEKLNDYLLDGNKFDGDIPDEIYLPFKGALDKAKA